MKVNPLTQALSFLDRVKEKTDADSRGQRQQQNQGREQPKQNEPEVINVDDETVSKAIDTFKADEQTQAAGLTAATIGQGPGLKVILKDGTGAIVRQFTGEEFLKLREAVNAGKAPGKILDQKF